MSKPFQDRWIVHFEGIDDRDGADRLAGAELRAAPMEDPDALWVHELIGSQVVDAAGTAYGAVVAVVANPASDLLELESGGLIPLTFVVVSGDGRIVVDIPEGLLDL